MRLIRKFASVVVVGILAGGVLAGCSGINASGSVSPLNFLLPGLIKVIPQKPPQVPAVEVVEVLV